MEIRLFQFFLQKSNIVDISAPPKKAPPKTPPVSDQKTQGALPVQAYLCDLEMPVTEHFAFSFEMSWAWPLAPIVRSLHFWGAVASWHLGRFEERHRVV